MVSVSLGMDRYEIYENCDDYIAFPEPDAVFATDFEKRCLLALGILKIELSGSIHDVLIAAPIGDDEGRIGKSDTGEFCAGLWLTYSKDDSKWALDCKPDDLLSFDIARAESIRSYEEQKHLFLQDGCILSHGRNRSKFSIFSVGGKESTNYWNWYSRVKRHISHRLVDIPVAASEKDDMKYVVLVGGDGNDYMYLGTVEASVYSRPLLPTIRVFYNPVAKRVLVIHDYS